MAFAAEAGYVNPTACRPCHAALYASYTQTGMGRSFSKQPVATPGTYHHKASNRRYEVFERGGRWWMSRHILDREGRRVQKVEKTIDSAVGSGNHAITYLHRAESGKLLQLPLSWYAEGGGAWAMSPGYDRRDHFGFRREVSKRCLFCHNGYPSISNSGLAGGIDCQRCHGPGEAHVREPGQGNIVNPARLESGRALDVCLQCHLETESRTFVDSLRRLGRDVYSFRPGERLADYRLHFDMAPGPQRDARFEINGAGYGMLASACFVKSEGRLNCTTCHDPHQAVRGAVAVAIYRSACQGCHRTAHAREITDCTACHMPKRRTADAVHVVMTDHRILRRPPPGNPREALRETQEPYIGPLQWFARDLPASPADEYYLAAAEIRGGSAVQNGVGRLEKLIREKAYASLPAVQRELAEGYHKLGRLDQAAVLFARALSAEPQNIAALIGAGNVELQRGRLRHARRLLESARMLAPDDGRVLNPLAVVLAELGETGQAVELLRRATQTNPDDPAGWLNLGIALVRIGDRAGAEAAFREALRLQPDLAAAHHQLEQLRTAVIDPARAR